MTHQVRDDNKVRGKPEWVRDERGKWRKKWGRDGGKKSFLL